jgi:hypothetical protein
LGKVCCELDMVLFYDLKNHRLIHVYWILERCCITSCLCIGKHVWRKYPSTSVSYETSKTLRWSKIRTSCTQDKTKENNLSQSSTSSVETKYVCFVFPRILSAIKEAC